MDVPYFIKEHLSISASNEATLKKYFVEVNPRQSWPWKQNGTKILKKGIQSMQGRTATTRHGVTRKKTQKP